MHIPRLLALVVPLILLTLFVGCGGDDDTDETESPTTSESPVGSPSDAAPTRTPVSEGSPTSEATEPEATATEASPTTDATEETATPAETGTATGGSAFTIVAVNLEFETTEFEAPPDTEITVVLDNQDQGVPHNIAFWDGPEAGEGELLSGCISGCEEDDVRTEIVAGPAEDQITFTTPTDEGEYAYWCEVHPTTMVGTLTITSDASVPSD